MTHNEKIKRVKVFHGLIQAMEYQQEVYYQQCLAELNADPDSARTEGLHDYLFNDYGNATKALKGLKPCLATAATKSSATKAAR